MFAGALVTGIFLTAALVYLAGVMAALPIPRLPEHFSRAHEGVLMVTLGLFEALPLTLVAWAVGRLAFRVLRDSSLRLLIAIGLPWVVYSCVGPLEYIRFSGYDTGKALSIILSPIYLTAWIIIVLSVPAGLWLAWTYRQKPRATMA
jgi:hypothetical protein